MPERLKLKSLSEVNAHLDALERSKAPAVDGGWSVAQVLIHCAQSIEYSMSGYPAAKGALFQKTVGRLALRKFLGAGAMSHDLAAPIPKAPEPPATSTLAEGLARLRKAIYAFRSHPGPFEPHFAYGPVTREQYDQVHAMHVANHLEKIRL
jgi:hypothetical protein